MHAKREDLHPALHQADIQKPTTETDSKSGRAGEFRQKIEALRARQRKYQEALSEMEKSGARELSLTDADGRRMHKIGIGYNGQIAVEAKHKLIAAQEVVNEATDHGQL